MFNKNTRCDYNRNEKKQELQKVPGNPFKHYDHFDEHCRHYSLQTISFLVKKNHLEQFKYQLRNLIEHHLTEGIWRIEKP